MIERVLITVSDKRGIKELVEGLYEHNQKMQIIASSGTAGKIAELGYPVTKVEEYTGIKEAPEGLVKTLNSIIHAGILLHEDISEHEKYMKKNGIKHIDGVIVNFYPFEKAAEKGYEKMIENIDIGGPALARAAAKASLKYRNMDRKKFVIIDPEDYPLLLREIKNGLSIEFVVKMAKKVFEEMSKYDETIRLRINTQHM